MFGLFLNSASANGIGNALLIPFYCSILADKPVSEQLRISSLIMVVFGIGAMVGGPILGLINDRFGGPRNVSKASFLLLMVIYGSLIVCNEAHTYGFLCYLSSFWIGSNDSMIMTQLSVMIARYYADKSSQLFALFNLVKMPFMSMVIYMCSAISTQSDYRLFYWIILVQSLLGQLLLMLFFPFGATEPRKEESEMH